MAAPNIPNWQKQILLGINAPITPANLTYLNAWQRAEGGNYQNNPFNTTLRTPAQIGPANSAGVRGYASPQAGIKATINTLQNGRYANIITALRQGTNAMSAADALANSPWGTGALVKKILGSEGDQTSPSVPDVLGTSDPLNNPNVPTNKHDAMAKAEALAADLQDSHDKTGDWSSAVDRILSMQSKKENLPGLKIGFQDILNSARPSERSVGILANLGGIAEKAARHAQEEIQYTDPIDALRPYRRPPPSRAVGQLPTGKGPVDVRIDHNEEVHPETHGVVQLAKKYLGTPYLWGGADPRKGFDCSGFVQWCYRQKGVNIGRTTWDQIKDGKAVNDPKDLTPGDVVFFATEGGKTNPTHEGMYLGNGQFIHAPHTGDVVKISSLNDSYYQDHYITGRHIEPDFSKKSKLRRRV